MERKNSLNNLSKEKLLLNKRTHFLKNNFLQQENTIGYCENLTFRENFENKENNDPNELRTIMKKEKKSFLENFNTKNNNAVNFFNNNGEKNEKPTPGFAKYQQKIYKDDLYSPEIFSETQKLGDSKSMKKKKMASCLWESFNTLQVDENYNNASFENLKPEHKTGAYLANMNIARKMKIPTNNFWKKFIGKNEKTEKIQTDKTDKSDKNVEKTQRLQENRREEKNELNELKSEITNLNERMSRLEKIMLEKDGKMEKLSMKYRKLKTNNLILQQNIKLLQNQANVSLITQENKFENGNEKIIKTLNEFEILLRKSILSSTFDFKSKKNSNSLKNAGNYYEALKFYEKAIIPIKEKLLLSKKNEPNSEEKRNIEIMRDMVNKFK